MKKHPILYESTEKNFMTNGIGVLSDALQCDVAEELNGMYELFLVYPLNGALMRELRNGRIIYADASKEMGCQPFRILRVNKLLNGLVNVYAVHISYDLSGIQLPPFDTAGISDGMSKIKPLSTSANDFKFESLMIDSPDPVTFTRKTPTSVRSYLMGAKNSLLQAYGGEFVFDGFQVRHAPRRGSDKGYRVRYGVNLIDLNQEESIENTYTGFYPYYKDEYMFMDLTETYDFMYPHEVDTSKLEGKIVNMVGTFTHSKVVNVDLSPMFDSAPLSTDELRDKANQYRSENNIGVPTVSLDLRFESLKNLPEYSNIPTPEDVSIGDTIHVDYVKIGVSASARINSIVYDALAHKTKRVTIGDVKNSVTDSIVKSINTQKTPTISDDKLNLSGYVTFAGLGPNGTTEIDGGRIKTGEIRSQNYLRDLVVLDSSVEESLTAKKYYFQLPYDPDGDLYYVNFFQDIPVGGKIEFDPKENKVTTYNSRSELLESVYAKTQLDADEALSDYENLDLKSDSFFSRSGTMINLNTGDIISKAFSVINGNAAFDGSVNSNYGKLGVLRYTDSGLSIPYGGTVDFGKDYEGKIVQGVSAMSMSDSNFLYVIGVSDPDTGLLSSVSGFEIGHLSDLIFGSFPRNLVGYLYGNWKAKPYTSNTMLDLSEIVTKQDLISLGLIE